MINTKKYTNKIYPPRIIERIKSLAVNTRPQDLKKISGQEQYRIRQGDYTIVYSIEDKDLLIDIFKIGNRRAVRA
jgi:mRNA interferase RelE/StbE